MQMLCIDPLKFVLEGEHQNQLPGSQCVDSHHVFVTLAWLGTETHTRVRDPCSDAIGMGILLHASSANAEAGISDKADNARIARADILEISSFK